MGEAPKRESKREWIVTASWTAGRYPVNFKPARVRGNNSGVALRRAARAIRQQIRDGAIPKGKSVEVIAMKVSYVKPQRAEKSDE